MIMVGQVYSYKKIGNFVITNITEEKISRIWQDGSVDEIDINAYDGRMHGILVAEYGRWQDAVNSDDFKMLGSVRDEELQNLRNLLKECKPYIQKEMETIKGAGFCNCDWAWKTSDLLTCINVALGESEE